MIFDRNLKTRDYNIHFHQETTDRGCLIRQTLDVVSLRKDRESFSYNLKRPAEELKKNTTLYHVTFKSHLEGILKEGLVPGCGCGYKNHWLSFFWDDEIAEKLYPGVFLMVEKPINGFGYKEDFPCFTVNIDDLDLKYLFIDDSLDNSFIYTKMIEPEKLVQLKI